MFTKAIQLRTELVKLQNEERARLLRRYFKTGKGEYAQGDIFLGLTVGQVRAVAKECRSIPLSQAKIALHSPYHEMRLASLILLKSQFEKGDAPTRERICNMYMRNTQHINNWDLVDVSAPTIVGTFLLKRDRSLLYTLIHSQSVWERRIALLATSAFIREGQYEDTLKLCTIVQKDAHDLIHKAAGWMLREVGKKDEKVLRNFLDTYASMLPRTMLRYAIEKLSRTDREHYMVRTSRPVPAALR